MFGKVLRFGANTFRSFAVRRTIAVSGLVLAADLLTNNVYSRHTVHPETVKASSKQSSSDGLSSENEGQIWKIEEESIFLNKHSYMSRLLGNKSENYILVVCAEETPESTASAIKTAKHIKKITKNSGQNLNVYIVTRPALEDVKKLANRIMDFKIFEREDNPQPIEVYIKTVHSPDMVFVKCKRESFFTDYKSEKFTRKLSKFIQLFENIGPASNVEQIKGQEQRLADVLQRQYLKIDQPVILKCVSPATTAASKKQSAKEIKSFKRLCFLCMERKLLPLKTKIIIIDNKELIKNTGLAEGGLYILRNDIVQKLESSVDVNSKSNQKSQQVPLNSNAIASQEITSQSQQPVRLIIDDSFMYLPNSRNSQTNKNEKLAFFTGKLESYGSFKAANSKLMSSIEQLTAESSNSQSKEELDQVREEAAFVNFIMPRVTYLRDSKFGSIGKLFKKITFAKDKNVLSLQLQSDDKSVNHHRINVFKQLYAQYKNEFTFMLVDTNEIVDLFPHIEENQPPFSIFNFFKVDKSLSKVEKYYKHLIFPFEKYFLEDAENFYEDYEQLAGQVDSILLERGEKRLVVNQTGMIQSINAEVFNNLLKTSTTPFLVQVLDESPTSRLAQITLNRHFLLNVMNETQSLPVYRMGHLNQHYFLKGRDTHRGPIYVYADPKSKKILIQPAKEINSKSQSRQELIDFLNAAERATTTTTSSPAIPQVEDVEVQTFQVEVQDNAVNSIQSVNIIDDKVAIAQSEEIEKLAISVDKIDFPSVVPTSTLSEQDNQSTNQIAISDASTEQIQLESVEQAVQVDIQENEGTSSEKQ